jgi:hypothetical protein
MLAKGNIYVEPERYACRAREVIIRPTMKYKNHLLK